MLLDHASLSVVDAAVVGKPSITETVAIIVGGVAGLFCANQLSSSPLHTNNVTVFDTGCLRSGGCSVR
jgi:glycine/D-amino acid oxidase-like deaminating enzyme